MTAVSTISELSTVPSTVPPDIPVNPEVFPDDGVFSCADEGGDKSSIHPATRRLSDFERHNAGDNKRFHARMHGDEFQVYGTELEHVAMCPTWELACLVRDAVEYKADSEDNPLITDDRVRKILPKLTYREREIIKLRYGFTKEGYRYTLEEVGHIFKVTRERIRNIQKKAEAKILEFTSRHKAEQP